MFKKKVWWGGERERGRKGEGGLGEEGREEK